MRGYRFVSESGYVWVKVCMFVEGGRLGWVGQRCLCVHAWGTTDKGWYGCVRARLGVGMQKYKKNEY